MKYIHELKVTGSGSFPLDMLRYDSCWPATETDSHTIRASIDGRPTERTVTIKKYSDRRMSHEVWTKRRWESFGWKVQGADDYGEKR